MNIMEFVIREDGILLKFEYNREMVKKIKRLQGRHFDSKERGWVIPLYSIDELKDFIELPDDILKSIEKMKVDQESILNSIKLKLPLKPFQKDAVNFLITKQKSMLCADMGLGKTCISIAYGKYLLDRKMIEKIIVICPKTVRKHWKNEIEKFIDEKAIIIETKGKPKKQSWIDSLDSKFVILNYEQIFNYNNAENIQKIIKKSTLMVLDEVTRIKNVKAKISRRVKRLKTTYKVVLTGRPLENRPEELFSINGFLENNILGTWDYFKKKYIIYDNFGRPLKYINLQDLGTRLKNIMFRCKKKDVLDDLPERIDNVYSIKLSSSESLDYVKIERIVNNEIDKYNKGNGTIKSVLSVIQISKMFCNHPNLVKNSTSKTAKSVEITTEKHSKIDELLNILKEVDAKVLIFSQYAEMCKIIGKELKKKDYDVVVVTGKDKDKDAKIEEFRDEAQIMVSTDVMGYGVNLQFASYIINYDLSWNPAVNEQRIARLHRMGQKNVVNVINLVIEDSDKIEQRIKEVLGEKEDIYNQIFEF